MNLYDFFMLAIFLGMSFIAGVTGRAKNIRLWLFALGWLFFWIVGFAAHPTKYLEIATVGLLGCVAGYAWEERQQKKRPTKEE